MKTALPASFAEKSRWVLFALLVPLLAWATREAARYDDKPVMQLALSPNGKRLYVFRGEFDYRNLPYGQTYEEVETWDVTTLRRIERKKTEPEPIFPSSDGRCFFQLTEDRKVRILEPGSFEVQKEITLPTIPGEEIFSIEGNDRMLLVESAGNQNKVFLTIIDLTGYEPSIIRSEEDSSALLSANGNRLFVAHHDTTTNTWSTEVQMIDNKGMLIPTHQSFAGIPLVVSDDGNIVFSGQGSRRAIHDLRKGAVRRWGMKTIGAPINMSLVSNGRVLRVIDTSGKIWFADTSTTKTMRTVQLRRPDAKQWFTTWGLTFPLDGNRLVGVINRTPWVWDTATGKRIAPLPDHRASRAALGALCIAWCVLWVGLGTKIRRRRPWLDVLVIHAPLIVIIIHAAVRPVSSIDRALVAISIGLLTSLLGMLIVWWIHGRMRWSLRLTGMVAGGAAVAGLLLASGHGNDMGVWNVMLGSGSYVVSLAVLLKLLRWLGIGIQRACDRSYSADGRWQMPLKDILLITTAIALLFTVGRFADPASRPLRIVLYLTLHGVLLAITVFCCTVVAFLPRWWALFLPMVPITAGICGAGTFWCFGRSSIDPLWWCEVLYASTAIAFFCSMCVFRLHGYRLDPRPRAPG